MHLTPAGFPFGMPGIAELIDGAMQHAPQFERQIIVQVKRKNKNVRKISDLHYRIVALLHYRIVALLHCRIVALSHRRIVALPL